MKSLIFGTSNSAKVTQLQSVLRPIGVTVSGLPESAKKVNVVEDGVTAQENARKKATTYARALNNAVLSMDNALFLEGLPREEQPSVHVRRINGKKERSTDKEMLDYYVLLIEKLGKRVRGHWDFALCYARPDGSTEEMNIISPRIFVSEQSPVIIEGFPLLSIQIDPMTEKYLSEMTQREQDVFWQQTIGTELAIFVKRVM